MITKDQFLDYEDVRDSGIINMCAIRSVVSLSGLKRDVIKDIQKNYDELKKKYLPEEIHGAKKC